MKHVHHSRRGTSRLFALCALVGLLTSLLAAGRPAFAQAVRIIFLHHSVGENLTNQGNVRQGLTALGYEFYDHGYNDDGLRLADGSYTGTNFDVPGDNTDPDGFADIFAQPLHDPPDNTFSHLMEYDVIAFKSCYPTSNIGDDYQLNEYKSYYLAIRDRMDQYPDKIFVVVTQPPQVPGDSDLAEAERARAFANWLKSDEYLSGHPNVFTFDFFDLLADDDNFLRAEYRFDDYDGHPNERANRAIGPIFVDFVDQAIQSYDTGVPRPTAAAPTQPPEQPAPPPEEAAQPPAAPPPTAGIIDDFESAGYWETDAETGSTVECGLDAETAHGGAASLRLDYSIEPYSWVDCGRYFESLQDWNGGTGLSLWVRSAEAGEWVTLMLFSGDLDGPTPFEVGFETTESWSQIILPWADFTLAEWADEGGLSQIDPTRVTGYGFSVGADDTDNESTLWIDDVGLATGEEPVEGPVEEPIEEPGEEPEPGSGICPGAAAVLLLGVLLAGRRRK
jgi:MYXO-CTERM domain-containing protein